MNVKNGRSVVLWPHGILFRDSEMEMRKKMIESDLVECVIGLGPNLFYNSPMESCLLICRTNKKKERKNKVLFINAVNEVRQEKSISFLDETHIQKIYSAYKDFNSIQGFCSVVGKELVLEKKGNLNITLYVDESKSVDQYATALDEMIQSWSKSSVELKKSLSSLISELKQ